MANTKISEMEEASSVSSNDVLPIVQGGNNKKATLKTLSKTVQGLLVPDSLPIGTVVDFDGETVPENWEEVEDEDTGWIPLELSEGIIPQDNTSKYECKYRKIGNQVHVVGCVKGITAENTVIATLPEGYRPSYQYRYITGRNTISNSILQMTTAGQLSFIGLTEGGVVSSGGYAYIQTSFIVD